MTIIRTSNWKAMVLFYRNLIHFDSEVNDSNRVVRFRKPPIEIQLERVAEPGDHEVIGALEFTSTEDKLDTFLNRRKEEDFELHSNDGFLELAVDDPDGNTATLVAEELSKAA